MCAAGRMGSSSQSDGRPRRWGPQEHLERPPSIFERHREEQRLRHAEPGWYEWILREFVRYWYVLGVLAVVVLVPLQIEYTLMPTDGPAQAGLPVTAIAMLAAAVALIVAGALGYRYLWLEDGWVQRAIERHEEREKETDVSRND